VDGGVEHEADHGERDHGLYNAPMESFSGSLKTELDVDGPFETRQAVRTALLGFVEPGGSPDVEPGGSPDIEGFHNRQRLHAALGYTTPASKEELAAAA